LIIAGIAGVLCCGGLVAGGFGLYKAIDHATRPERDAANTFLRDLEAGNTGGAYDHLCARLREQYTRDDFAVYVNGRPKLQRHKIIGVSINNSDGVTTGSVNSTLHYADGSSGMRRLTLVKESGAWRVCGNPY
jgi:hypothetical protein